MLVFRDGRRRRAVRPLLEQLTHACRRAPVRPGEALAALLRAGELECGLADAGSPAAAEIAAASDAAAEALLGREVGAARFAVLGRLGDLPEAVELSVPEGFAYYALHPLDYVRVLDQLPRPRRALVIGIRSIGTTLSAVVRAGLAARGAVAARMTVRPVGHPWARETHFSEDEKRRIEAERAAGAQFLIVDEGPGLSGSSFLSVGEALVAAGVPTEQITLVGSHEVDPARMCARDAAARWACFRYLATAPFVTPAGARELSGGAWRRELLSPEAQGPSSWTQFERRKYGVADSLFKFEGLGPYGAAVRARATRLAELGFAPQVRGERDGFTEYQSVEGRPMSADASEDTLRRLAEYCAVRAREFPADADAGALWQLVEVNWREAFGEPIAAPALPVERPVIADGRMHPHEWLRTADGKMLKTDGVEHGDDHFFPGPVDIAWDLAGAIVEWGLDSAGAAFLLGEYRRLTGDDASARVGDYRMAYLLFRLGYCQMAADAMRGSDEEGRLRRDEARYRALLSPAKAGSISKVAA